MKQYFFFKFTKINQAKKPELQLKFPHKVHIKLSLKLSMDNHEQYYKF